MRAQITFANGMREGYGQGSLKRYCGDRPTIEKRDGPLSRPARCWETRELWDDESGWVNCFGEIMHIPLVRLQAGSLEITLTIVDPCVLDYVSRFAEVEHPNAVSNCIQVGARALISVGDRLSTTALTDALKEATANQKTLLETLSLETRENVTRTAEELPKKLDAILKLVEKISRRR